MIHASRMSLSGGESALTPLFRRASEWLRRLCSRDEDRTAPPAPARVSGRVVPDRDPASALAEAVKAIGRRDYGRAEDLLEQELDHDPDCARAHALAGALRERRGQAHAAYQSYKRAILIDSNCPLALVGVRRYCGIMGLDERNPRLNPAASRREVDA